MKQRGENLTVTFLVFASCQASTSRSQEQCKTNNMVLIQAVHLRTLRLTFLIEHSAQICILKLGMSLSSEAEKMNIA